MVFFLVSPQYNKLQSLQLSLAQKQAEYNAQFEYYSEIKDADDKILEKKDDIQKIDDSLPSKPDFGQLIYYFQGTARDSGIILKNLTISQPSGGKNVKDISFSLSLVGTYLSLGNFMQALENSARVFEITTISFGAPSQLSAASQFQSSQLFNYTLEVKTHSY